jgi:hypothetical protein
VEEGLLSLEVRILKFILWLFEGIIGITVYPQNSMVLSDMTILQVTTFFHILLKLVGFRSNDIS